MPFRWRNIVIVATLMCCCSSLSFGGDNRECSVEVLGSTDMAISDGLPNGVNVTNVNSLIRSEVINALASKSITQNGSKNRYSLRYNITYFGHKWKGLGVDYIISYNVFLKNEVTGEVVKSEKDNHSDDDLPELLDELCQRFINLTIDGLNE